MTFEEWLDEYPYEVSFGEAKDMEQAWNACAEQYQVEIVRLREENECLRTIAWYGEWTEEHQEARKRFRQIQTAQEE